MPAAFKATFSDWKLIRTRGVVQVVFEVPLECAGQAYEVLGGMPNPASEVWCAVARLGADMKQSRKDGDASDPPISGEPVTTQLNGGDISTSGPCPPSPASNEPPAKAGKRLAQRAGILCNDPRFWKFCREDGCIVHTKEQAAEHVRAVCEVQTRRDIRPGTVAEQRLNLIISAFEAWKLGPQCGAA